MSRRHLTVVAVLLDGLMRYRRGLASSLAVTHITLVAGSMCRPSACPITLHVFSTLPPVLYSAIVLVTVVLPSLAD